MRIKANFSVFPRKLASGRRVFYYQCYDSKSKRQWAKSTGKNKRTEAVKYCEGLLKNGLLIPLQKVPTFAEFAVGWWYEDTCKYIKWRQLHNPMGVDSILLHRGRLENYLKDYFASFRLDEITTSVIEQFLVYLSEKNINAKKDDDLQEDEDNTKIKKLKPQTINYVLITLRLMLGEAVKQKLIQVNPCIGIPELKEEQIKRGILTVEEVRKLFPPRWHTIWDSEIMFKINRLAACTGMRIAEIQGLRGEYVFDDYIYITGQFSRRGYVEHTKNKENRNIPLSNVMRRELDPLLALNGDGYVFSDDGGKTPIPTTRIRDHFKKALKRIGINDDERNKRNLTFHSWRHFLNTLLRMEKVADSKVQSVTGHKSLRMTEHYTHFDTRKFTEVRDVQTNLLTFDKPKTKQGKTVKKTEKTKAVAKNKKPVKKTVSKKK
jgi:integrase